MLGIWTVCIETPKGNKTKHYAQWLAEKEGRPTWKSLIKNEVDEAINSSLTDKQFFYQLKEKGYAIKQGKDITVRPQVKNAGSSSSEFWRCIFLCIDL